MDNVVRFTIPTCPFEENKKLFSCEDLIIYPGLTTIVGCNGSGKSTLLKILAKSIKKREDAKLIEYDDRYNGGHNLMEKMAFNGQMETVANMMMSSEGERIYIGIGDAIAKIGKVSRYEKPKELWILMDAIGSGLSIDNIQEIKSIIPFMEEQTPEITIFFIVCTNEYEFTVDSRNLDVTTFNYVRFKDYENYKSYILETREKKNNRKW